LDSSLSLGMTGSGDGHFVRPVTFMVQYLWSLEAPAFCDGSVKGNILSKTSSLINREISPEE
jgi:hypothetical protein